MRNWIAKNGLPPVFSCTSCAKGCADIPLAVQGIGDQPADIVEPEGRQHNLLHSRSGLADRVQRPRERVRRTDFVVPVGPNQHQVPYVSGRVIRCSSKFKGCRVQPLQIVEEQRKRVLRPGEHAEEPPEHQLEAVLRILRRQVRNGRLFPDDELDLRDEVDDQLAVRAQPPPAGQPRHRSTSASLLTRI